jgi:hypothetical protein
MALEFGVYTGTTLKIIATARPGGESMDLTRSRASQSTGGPASPPGTFALLITAPRSRHFGNTAPTTSTAPTGWGH